MKILKSLRGLSETFAGRASRRLLLVSIFLQTAILLLGPQASGLAMTEATENASTPDMQAAARTLASGQETISLLSAIFKAAGALILVVGLMLLFVYLMKKAGLARGRFKPHSLIKVMDIHALAPKKHVAVLDVAGEFIVIGITDQQISMLTTLEKNSALSEPAAPESKSDLSLPPFAKVFSGALHKLKKDPTQDKRGADR